MSLGLTLGLLALSLAVFTGALVVARRPLEIGRVRPPTLPFLFVGLVCAAFLTLHLVSLLADQPLGGRPFP